ncbi:MAG: hypothetical protein QXK06_00870 [Candidatus Diapherotrites archaeon]
MELSFNRAQAALEYMIIAATLLLATALMLAYILPSYNNAVQIDQANTALNTLTATADKVYALGPGSALIAEINLPDGITSIKPEGKTITIKFNGSSSIAVFDFNVSGTIPSTKGYHKVQAIAVDENVNFIEVV